MNEPQGTVQVREATAADAEVIAEFNRSLALESEGLRLDPELALAGVRQGLARPDLCRYYLAQRGGQIVGQVMITYEWSDWRAGVCWWIQSVYVRPAYRQTGVFRALYGYVKGLAHGDREVCGLRLYVHKDNRAAQRTYQRVGLGPTGHLVYECDWSGARCGSM